MRAVVLGCSHAAGSEMDKALAIDSQDRANYGWTHSFPMLIAQQLGYKPENWAIPGGSNDAMFRIFTEQLPTLTVQDCVIVCWTGINRTEIWHEVDQRWLNFCPNSQRFSPIEPTAHARSGSPVTGNISLEKQYVGFYEQWMKFQCNDISDRLNKIKNIQALNALAKAHDIPVINIDSFWPVPCVNNIDWAVNETFFDWAIRNNYARTDLGHFFLDAHRAYADMAVKNLTTNGNAV
jgi:hypothetical protein